MGRRWRLARPPAADPPAAQPAGEPGQPARPRRREGRPVVPPAPARPIPQPRTAQGTRKDRGRRKSIPLPPVRRSGGLNEVSDDVNKTTPAAPSDTLAPIPTPMRLQWRRVRYQVLPAIIFTL